jgi:hypothetical protein
MRTFRQTQKHTHTNTHTHTHTLTHSHIQTDKGSPSVASFYKTLNLDPKP